MITGELKNKIDKIWEIFWTGGITNPLSVIEQLTYLIFIKSLDDKQNEYDENASLLGIKAKKIFTDQEQDLRWKNFKHLDAVTLYDVVQNRVFPFIKSMGDNNGRSAYSKYMKDAIFIIQTPQLLEKIVTNLDLLPLRERDTKGDLYEYLLSKVATAGTNGQFRTPRHIIRMMVELMTPSPSDTIIDPAAGSAGFLVAAGEYLMEQNKDLLTIPEQKEHYSNSMFHGNDMDSTMLRIGAMNMMLHGVENPNIEYRDSLSEVNKDSENYTLVLANPPFKGSLDYDSVSSDILKITKTKKTELLFLALFLRILKKGGRCASIVPDGVLFGSSKAHQQIRKEIVDNHQLQAVISMPGGVFKPYAGVSTAILIFTKTGNGGTENVWFYDMQADGLSLDDKRQPVEENDIADIVARYHNLAGEQGRKRTDRSFLVPKKEIIENEYDLSINKYKEIEYEEVAYEAPGVILGKIEAMEEGILKSLESLKDIL